MYFNAVYGFPETFFFLIDNFSKKSWTVNSKHLTLLYFKLLFLYTSTFYVHIAAVHKQATP